MPVVHRSPTRMAEARRSSREGDSSGDGKKKRAISSVGGGHGGALAAFTEAARTAGGR